MKSGHRVSIPNFIFLLFSFISNGLLVAVTVFASYNTNSFELYGFPVGEVRIQTTYQL